MPNDHSAALSPERTAVRALPRRDRNAVIAGLCGITLVSWIYLVVAAIEMDGAMAAGHMMQLRAWSAVDFGLMFMMWTVMMIGMMVPSAAPTALVYAAVARKAARQGTVLAPTAVFVAGYLVMWTLFSAAATALQWGFEQLALLSPMMVATSPTLGGLLLVGSGIYQWTPAKDACLRHCRGPVQFISEAWRPGSFGAFRMGAIHGAYCLGCCWILMGILFVGGVMNLLCIAGITLFVLLEKLAPRGPIGGRLAGVALIAAGSIVLFQGF